MTIDAPAVRVCTTRVNGHLFAEPTAGAGPPIVFVHGLAVSSRYVQPTIRALADRYTCRAVDLPGFGNSDKPRKVLTVRVLDRFLQTAMPAPGASV